VRAVFAASIASAAISLLGLLGLSAVSVAPGAEAWRGGVLVAVGIFLVGWTALVLRARRRLASSRDAAIPAGLATAVVAGAVAYVVLVLLCSVG
jgi:hypothetical protein